MNFRRGLNRIFILLGVGAAIFGFVFGGQFARYEWKPDPEKVFYSFNWNQESIQKYYNKAKNYVKEKETANSSEQDYFSFLEPLTVIDPQKLPNYKDNPPEYNEALFKRTFPKELETPEYKIWIGRFLGGLVGFFLCFGGFHIICFVARWVINGFKDKII